MSNEAPNIASTLPELTKWSWSLRHLKPNQTSLQTTAEAPRVGDVVLVRVESIAHHSKIVTADNRHLRIYPGDCIAGVFGNRYATDAFEGLVESADQLSLLTGCGMIGTVRSAHAQLEPPTSVQFLGYLTDHTGRTINLKDRFFREVPDWDWSGGIDLVLVVGTSMNAGKTTVAAQLTRGLGLQGIRTAACKLTGSVSNRDQDSLRSASPCAVLDFSDFGFPSTYLSEADELRRLFQTLVAESAKSHPAAIVMEIADGVVQRETAMILRDPEIQSKVTGVVLAARDSLSALYAVEELQRLGFPVLAVTGRFTSSPLMVKEFQSRCPGLPVVSSVGDSAELAKTVLPRLGGVEPKPLLESVAALPAMSMTAVLMRTPP